MKGSEKFKRGTSGRGKFVRNTFDTDEFEKGKEEKRERARLVSKQSLIEDGTLVRWNNSSYITAQRVLRDGRRKDAGTTI